MGMLPCLATVLSLFYHVTAGGVNAVKRDDIIIFSLFLVRFYFWTSEVVHCKQSFPNKAGTCCSCGFLAVSITFRKKTGEPIIALHIATELAWPLNGGGTENGNSCKCVAAIVNTHYLEGAEKGEPLVRVSVPAVGPVHHRAVQIQYKHPSTISPMNKLWVCQLLFHMWWSRSNTDREDTLHRKASRSNYMTVLLQGDWA